MGHVLQVLLLVAVSFGLGIETVVAQRVNAAIRAPIGCVGGTDGCTSDISLAKAQVSLTEVSKRTAACEVEKKRKRKEGTEKPKRFSQDSGQVPWGSSIFGSDDPPCLASAATSHYLCENDAVGYGWATLDLLSDGVAALAALRENASSGVPFGNFIVVEASESPPNEQHLALCEVRVVGDAVGPPKDCATVAIITPTVTLLRRGATSRSVMCLASASFRLGGAIDISFEVQTKLKLSAFSDSFARMLKDDLGLITEQQSDIGERGELRAISFRSTAPLRDSPILKNGWRESLDFDLRLNLLSDKIGIQATTKPLVCRQASGQAVDYHGPTDAQKATYAMVLNDHVSRAIARSCKKFSPIDAKTVSCQ